MPKKPPRIPRANQPDPSDSFPHEPDPVEPELSAPAQPDEKPAPKTRRRAVVEQLSDLRDSVSEVLGQEIPEQDTQYRSSDQIRAAAERIRAKRGKDAPVAARNLSGRFIALIVITVLMVLAVLPSINTYIQQQAEISELQADIDRRKEEQEQLHAEIARWDDPAYVKQQARDRINLVMPGERKYLVIGDLPETETEPAESPHDVRADLPWADALFDSIRRAGTD